MYNFFLNLYKRRSYDQKNFTHFSVSGGGGTNQLLAITPELQTKVDEIFKERENSISQSADFSTGEKQTLLNALKEEKAKVERMSDEEIEEYLDNEDKERKRKNFEKPIVLGKGEEWMGWAFGATGLRVSSFFGGNIGGSYMVYASIGPKYNFTGEGWTMGTANGFSLSLPIGFGAINTSGIKNDMDFVLPIALEANYMFSEFMGFGLSAGLRYTFSPQKNGMLHMMDFYAGMDIYYGLYIEAGYVFYSSQDITLGNRTYKTDPLSGAITLNTGWRF